MTMKSDFELDQFQLCMSNEPGLLFRIFFAEGNSHEPPICCKINDPEAGS